MSYIFLSLNKRTGYLLICSLLVVMASSGCKKEPVNINRAAGDGDIATIRHYLDNGGNVNFASKGRATLLYLAALQGRREMVEFLLSKGADINLGRPKSSESPLSGALSMGYSINSKEALDVSRFLISRGARISFYDAIMMNDMRRVRSFIKNGADVNAKPDIVNWPPIFTAAFFGRDAVGKELIKYGAKVNVVDNLDGSTPLHVAAMYGKTAFVELLISNHADLAAKDAAGYTALHLAKQFNHPDTAAVLLKNGAK